jgi:hypothetical protein
MTRAPKDYKALVSGLRPFAFCTRLAPIDKLPWYEIHDIHGPVGDPAPDEVLAWFNAWIWLIEHEMTEEQINDLK